MLHTISEQFGFAWPVLLWALALVPAAAWAYRRAQRRATTQPVAFPATPMAMAAMLESRGRRRHVPAIMFIAGLACALLALTRPLAPLMVPAERSAIMLVIDISGSMRSTDIEPSRMEAAKIAAKAFLADVPDTVRVGLVTFGGYATLAAPPGTDHERIGEIIDSVSFIRRTAIGEGLLEAVVAMPGRVRPNPDGSLPDAPPGPKPAGIVILLSDGRSNTGIDSTRAAEIARAQDVIVHTIGVGSRTPRPDSFVLGGAMDESELQAVAQAGGGTYHHASSAKQLHDVYRGLARSVGWERRPDEVSAVFALLGALALVASVFVSRLRTHPLDL
jgi:Ca-activated chloride channel family protein